MELVQEIADQLIGNTMFQMVALAVIADTVFGLLRACRQKKFNSSLGIDGAIRKTAMLVSLVFLLIFDNRAHLNLIGFIPEEVRSRMGLSTVGTMEFFSLLYLGYEVVSILKNMALCGLPIQKLWKAIKDWLRKYTKELPDDEE